MSSMALGVHFSGSCGSIADTGEVSKEDTLPYYQFTLALKTLVGALFRAAFYESGRCRRVTVR